MPARQRPALPVPTSKLTYPPSAVQRRQSRQDLGPTPSRFRVQDHTDMKIAGSHSAINTAGVLVKEQCAGGRVSHVQQVPGNSDLEQTRFLVQEPVTQRRPCLRSVPELSSIVPAGRKEPAIATKPGAVGYHQQ